MRPTILCIDDEPTVRNSLKDQLRRSFGDRARIEVASGAEEALELLGDIEEEEETVAVVISDQLMPGMKGDELLVEIHQRAPEAVKILLSGQAPEEAVENARQNADLFAFLPKPWSRDSLQETVAQAWSAYDNRQRPEDPDHS